jgi:cysteine-rich repeat protein
MTRLLILTPIALSFLACGPPSTTADGRCGNSILTAGEQCDDGNSINEDACTNDCENSTCGDGIVRVDLGSGITGFEACDDGNANDDDACLINCQLARCGDGVVRRDLTESEDGFEACDDGNDDNWDGCSNGCGVMRCGDGELQPEMGEVCDDGNDSDTDACTNNCRPAGCGDGSVWEGNEGCDDGNRDNFDACLNTCASASCGDGVHRRDLAEGSEGFEACDDGNLEDDDSCLNGCAEPRCGDGIHRRDLHPADPAFEECDDGNDSDDDDCSTACVSLGCGNGRINDGESCDDGNIEDADACLNNCQLALCGDGVARRDRELEQDGYEACDDGNLSDDDACTSTCIAARCGDQITRLDLEEGVEGYEACDDGNEEDNDACVACANARCGDEITREDLEEGAEGFEACDDGNEVDTDGCRNGCIAAVCGDGIVRQDVAEGQVGYEACDDGNNDEEDDCASDCYPPGQGGVSLISTHAVSGGDFSGTNTNFHPQGICYDHANNEVAMAHQGTSRLDFLAPGQPGRTRSIATNLHHQTSVACDGERFLVVDYTGNASRVDMHNVSRNGAVAVHWNEVRGYGGFPVAVFGDDLWRTDLSSGYNWTNLTRLHRTNKNSPGEVRSSFAGPAGSGVGDLCHDGSKLWVLGYVHNRASQRIDLWAVNPTTGAILRSFPNAGTCPRGEPKGLACNRTNRRLYVYCYNEARGQDGALLEFRHP